MSIQISCISNVTFEELSSFMNSLNMLIQGFFLIKSFVTIITFELASFLHELIRYVYLDDLFFGKNYIANVTFEVPFFFMNWFYMPMQVSFSRKTCITIIASFHYELIQCVHSDKVCVLYDYFQKKELTKYLPNSKESSQVFFLVLDLKAIEDKEKKEICTAKVFPCTKVLFVFTRNIRSRSRISLRRNAILINNKNNFQG